MTARTLVGLGVAMVLLVVAALASVLFLRTVERDYLEDLERSMNVVAQTLVLQWTADLAAPPLSPATQQRLQGALRAVQEQTGNRLRVFAADGSLVADSLQLPAPADGEVLRRRPEVQAALGGQYGAYTRFADDTMQSMALYVAVPCPLKRKVAGVIYVSHSTADVVARLDHLRQPIRIALVSLGGLVALLGVSLAFSFKLALDRVQSGAGRMVAGHLEERLPVRGRDPVADIASHFNRLAAALQQKIRELEEERDRTRRFVQDMTHELKTPLAGLSGSVQALQGGALDDAQPRDRFLANIEADTDRLNRLVSSLLEVQRVEHEALRMVKFDMVSLCERVAEHYERAAARRHVTVRIEGSGEAAEGDPDKVERVLENLVENAVRHSLQGGVVVVAVRQSEGTVRVEVADSGPGIGLADRLRIFDRFYRGHQGESGTAGLGLAIARDIIVRHGGEIGVESEPGAGARFFFTLPSREGCR